MKIHGHSVSPLLTNSSLFSQFLLRYPRDRKQTVLGLGLASLLIPVLLFSVVLVVFPSAILLGGLLSFLFLLPLVLIPYHFGLLPGIVAILVIFGNTAILRYSTEQVSSFESENFPFLLILSSLIVTGISIIGNLYRNLANSLAYEKLIQREAHHRIKNNLLFINSLISLSINSLKTDEPQELFQIIQKSVLTTAHIHDAFSYAKDFDRIDLIEHFHRTFTDTIDITLAPSPRNQHGDSLRFTSGKLAFSLSLIVNEILENNRKHQPYTQTLTTAVILPETSDQSCHIDLTITPSNLPQDFSMSQSSKGLGLLIINSLLDQHSGTIDILSRSPATYRIVLHES